MIPQQRIVGIALIVIGVVLLIIGINSSHSFSDQMSNLFRGRFTDATTWYIVGGIGLAVLGLVMSALGMRSKPG